MATRSKMNETAGLFISGVKEKTENKTQNKIEETKPEQKPEYQRSKGGRKKLYGNKPKKYSLNLNEELFNRACEYCEEEGISFNYLVNRSLKKELDNLGK